jgi:hypothetical protein
VARKAAARKSAAKKVARKPVARKAAARHTRTALTPPRSRRGVAAALPPGRSTPNPPASPVPSPAPPAAERRRAARTSIAPVELDLPLDEEMDEPLVPGAPSSLVPDARTGHARAVATPEDELVAEGASDGGLRAGDADVNLQQAYSSGDETPGGDNPTPDQDIVDMIGRSLGVEYDDDEELRGAEKIADRDRRRWELDPASAEDFKDRKR